MLPVPEAASPMEGVSLVQLKLVPIILPENVILEMIPPLHWILFETAVASGVAFITIVLVRLVEQEGAFVAVKVICLVPLVR